MNPVICLEEKKTKYEWALEVSISSMESFPVALNDNNKVICDYVPC